MQAAERLTARRTRRGAGAASALVGVTLLLAACGGSASPGVATISGSKGTVSPSAATSSGAGAGAAGPATSSAGGGGTVTKGFAIAGSSRQNSLKLAACMRANGVPNFPDPNAQGVIQGSGIDPSSPSFQAAQRKCAKDTPNGGQPPSPAQQAQAQAQALKFSACMRAHGEPSFPDPQISTSGGGIRISLHPGSGLNPASPIFQAAQKACASILPGKFGGGPSPTAVGPKGG